MADAGVAAPAANAESTQKGAAVVASDNASAAVDDTTAASNTSTVAPSGEKQEPTSDSKEEAATAEEPTTGEHSVKTEPSSVTADVGADNSAPASHRNSADVDAVAGPQAETLTETSTEPAGRAAEEVESAPAAADAPLAPSASRAAAPGPLSHLMHDHSSSMFGDAASEPPSTAPGSPMSTASTPRLGRMTNQLQYLQKIVVPTLLRHQWSWPFKKPVDWKALGLPTYPDIIKQPMDIGTVKRKLAKREYFTSAECMADLELVWKNCQRFNQPSDDVFTMSATLEELYNGMIQKMPHPEEEVVRPLKNMPRPPILKQATALPRRQSTRQVKAPSREIPYDPSMESDRRLRACTDIIKVLFAKKHSDYAWPFYEPVDVVKLNLADYYDIVKEPMDLTTVKKNLESGMYASSEDFARDVRLIFNNCYLYNPQGTPVVACAKRLSEVFEIEFASMLEEQELKKSRPAARRAKPAPSPEPVVTPAREPVAKSRQSTGARSNARSRPQRATGPASAPASTRRAPPPVQDSDDDMSTTTSESEDETSVQEQIMQLQQTIMQAYQQLSQLMPKAGNMGMNMPMMMPMMPPMGSGAMATKKKKSKKRKPATRSKRRQHATTTGYFHDDGDDGAAPPDDDPPYVPPVADPTPVARRASRKKPAGPPRKRSKSSLTPSSKKKPVSSPPVSAPAATAAPIVSHRPIDSGDESGDEAVAMTWDEKRLLSQNINLLEDNSLLHQVVDIIKANEPSLRDTNSDEIEIDFDELQPRTLRELERFVQDCLTAQQEATVALAAQAKTRGRKPSTKAASAAPTTSSSLLSDEPANIPKASEWADDDDDVTPMPKTQPTDSGLDAEFTAFQSQQAEERKRQEALRKGEAEHLREMKEKEEQARIAAAEAEKERARLRREEEARKAAEADAQRKEELEGRERLRREAQASMQQMETTVDVTGSMDIDSLDDLDDL